ncbi:MAG TPA: hypothetical protein VMT91_04160, partial [Anaerolineales bacterium]|nr:hypothetical protein [Anaerolineales bacterium]
AVGQALGGFDQERAEGLFFTGNNAKNTTHGIPSRCKSRFCRSRFKRDRHSNYPKIIEEPHYERLRLRRTHSKCDHLLNFWIGS